MNGKTVHGARILFALVAMTLACVVMPARAATQPGHAKASDLKLKPVHRIIQCVTNYPSGNYERRDCRSASCRIQCPPAPKFLPRHRPPICTLTQTCNCTATKVRQEIDAEIRSCPDCGPLKLYHRLADLNCGFRIDDFWVPGSAAVANASVHECAASTGRPRVRIEWTSPTCTFRDFERLKSELDGSLTRREYVYQELLLHGCNFRTELPFDSGQPERVWLDRSDAIDAHDAAPARQPETKVRFSPQQHQQSTTTINCAAPPFIMGTPSWMYGGEINLICTSKPRAIEGVYTVLNDGKFDTLLDPSNQIAYLGFVWSGPVVLGPPPSHGPCSTCPASDSCPTKTRIIEIPVQVTDIRWKPFILFGFGFLALGTLLGTLARSVLARSAERTPRDVEGLAYENRFTDISVIVRRTGERSVRTIGGIGHGADGET